LHRWHLGRSLIAALSFPSSSFSKTVSGGEEAGTFTGLMRVNLNCNLSSLENLLF
jgi:hypothetical protein